MNSPSTIILSCRTMLDGLRRCVQDAENQRQHMMKSKVAAAPATGRAAGKVAIVTGGGGAIGRATALLLAREGARVVVTDSDPRRGEQTTALIAGEGGQASFARHDVGQEDDWRRLVDATLSQHHRFDILAHTVHAHLECALADLTIESLRAYQRPNLLGAWLGLKYAGPAVRSFGRGAIAIVTSTLGAAAQVDTAAPAMASAAIRLMVRAAAAEFAERNPKVRVNTVLADPAYFALAPETAPPAPRKGRSPFDVAHVVNYLTSDAARFLTGTEIVVGNPADAALVKA